MELSTITQAVAWGGHISGEQSFIPFSKSMFNKVSITYQLLIANTYNNTTFIPYCIKSHRHVSWNKEYSNYQQMRLVCPDANNMCKTDEIPNPQNMPGSMFVCWLHVDKWDQLNMSYAIWNMHGVHIGHGGP